MPDVSKRVRLPDVPDVGTVRRVKGSIVIDFSPDIRGKGRFLWSLSGQAFESEAVAESVRRRICQHFKTMPLEDAVARYRGNRSRQHKATAIVDRYLEAAPTLQSERTGRFLAPRTLAAYRGVLNRARPFLEGMTIAEATSAPTLRKFKAWFRLPEPSGRGLKSDQEARNAFAAFRAVVSWYRLERPDFPAPNWPTMPTAITAKRQNQAERNSNRLTLPEVVRGIEQIPENRRPLFWVLFYTQARPSEVRGVLGRDWNRPRLEIRRSAATKRSDAEIRPTTKTGETGIYELPEWVGEMIDRHCTGARFDAERPLFVNPDPLARGRIFSDDAIRDSWATASTKAGIPWVPPYRAFKHTQVSALLAAGISLEDLIAQCRWTSASMVEHYDERQDEKRGGVVARLDSLVSKVRAEK